VGSAFAAGSSDKPDLVAELPTKTQEVVSTYVDRFAKPGKMLYRFSAVIRNTGGAMDLYMQNGHAYQVIYTGGTPKSNPDPNKPASGGTGVTVEDRSSMGASFVYSNATGHHHWHFQQAAVYSLLLPGGGQRLADKVGFCMYDSWQMEAGGAKTYFKPGYKGSGPRTWCAPKDPGVTFTRMGISPQYGDLYAAQSADQWVDISGLAPGPYTIKAVVNPNGYVDESDPNNNTATAVRTIPGTIAHGLSTTVSGATTFTIDGELVAIDVPARKSGSGCAYRTSLSCYVFAKSSGPLTFAIATKPAHGTLTIVSQSGLQASVRYTPDSGYHGSDSATFRVTDVRQLQSLPATVNLTVS
jgi:hypothetical protein